MARRLVLLRGRLLHTQYPDTCYAFSSTVVKSQFAVTLQNVIAPCHVMAKSLIGKQPSGRPSCGAIHRERCDPEFPGEEQSNDDKIIQHATAQATPVKNSD
jgi:hypothetical protein